MLDRDALAATQRKLYEGIWLQDRGYGTRMSDVADTVDHRIIPHMRRVLESSQCSVVDFGAGDGRALKALRIGNWCAEGLGIDLVRPEVLQPWMSWRQQPLWDQFPERCDYAISMDVLEHIHTELVPDVMANIATAAPHGFLRIATRVCQYEIEHGLHLHETVESPEWWLERCREAKIRPQSWRVYPELAVEIWF